MSVPHEMCLKYFCRLADENRRLTQQLQKRKDTGSKSISSIETIERELTDVKHKYEEANRRYA